jgi:hypothetical protein
MNKKRGVVAFGEMFILVLGIIAISYSLGSEIGFVSGESYGVYDSSGKLLRTFLTEEEAIENQVDGGHIKKINDPEGSNRDSAAALPVASIAATQLFKQNNFQTVASSGYDAAFNSWGIENLGEWAGKGEILKITNTEARGIIGQEYILKDSEGVLRTYNSETGKFDLFSDGLKKSLTDKELMDSEGSLSGVTSAAKSDAAVKEGGLLSSIYGLKGRGVAGGIGASAAWGLSVYFGIKMVGGMLGFDEGTVNAAATALGLGTTIGTGVFQLAGEGGFLEGMAAKVGGAGNLGLIAGGVTAAAVFLLMYKKESTEIIKFDCKPWDAPIGGDDCEKCNNQAGGLPCSEYQCRALGQACELVNSEADGTSLCVNKHRGDVNQPIITPWENTLTPEFKYTPNNVVSPPDRGVFIQYENSQDGCIPAFTPLSFGIETDEPSRCKMDYVRKQKLEDMRFFFGGSSLFNYNHTQILSLPGPNQSGEGPILENGGKFDLFVKCTDAMGNENEGDFLFSFCVDDGPDTTPPLIVTTNLLNGMPVAYDTASVDIELYTNEPSNCKWSRRDQSYPEMENEMQCSRSVYEMNARMLYKCMGTLDGIQSMEENDYYFRCEDKPLAPENERNQNEDSYLFQIIGTQALYIDSVSPNETIKGSSNIVTVKLEVETRAGYNEGQASCYFSGEEDGEYILFSDSDNTNGYSSQELNLPEGSYEYFIKCVDLGGNTDNNKIVFDIETDNSAPLVVRA